MFPPYKIVPLSDRAALLSFGNTIDLSVHSLITTVQKRLTHFHFEGFVESVPAYSSLAVFYDPLVVALAYPEIPSPFDYVKLFLDTLCRDEDYNEVDSESRLLKIPVFYDGPDLAFVAAQHELTSEKVIQIHTRVEYRIFMIGFIPGFAYMGIVDDRIATARKSVPRTDVPAGSVGIAGNQTGIYPQNSPGGWQIIGHTPKRIFDPEKEMPCLFQTGDRVRFYSIDVAEFNERNEY